MAKYTIEDTTLQAYGDAVRRFTSPTRIEEWDKWEWEWELPLPTEEELASNMQGFRFVPKYVSNYPICYIRVKDPSRGYAIEFSQSPNNEVWDYHTTPEYRWATTSNKYIRRTDNIDEPCILIFRYEDSLTGDPVGEHYTEEVVNTLTPGSMVEVLNNFDLDAVISESALTITGVATYKFSYGGWDWFINQMGDKITTQNITNANYMFAWSQVVAIPFTINMDKNIASYVTHDLSYMFNGAIRLVEAPMIYGVKSAHFGSLFSDCQSLTTIPEGFAEDWNWEYVDNLTSAYTGSMANMFYHCYNLRTIPQILLSHGNPYWSYNYPLINSGFNGCHSLEKIENVFIPYKGSYTSSYANAFSNSVKECYRLKKLTLATQEDGTPYTVSWGYQVIDLTANVGWSTTNYTGLDKRTDFTTDTLIDSEEKWRGYIDGSYPDGWANDVAYSTFGATAAKELFASLPIASGTGNTVKLNANATSAISGEAMSSLTEEDIAVATAKGWTITLL